MGVLEAFDPLPLPDGPSVPDPDTGFMENFRAGDIETRTGYNLNAEQRQLTRGYTPILKALNAGLPRLQQLDDPGVWLNDMERRPSTVSRALDFSTLVAPRVTRRQQIENVHNALRMYKQAHPGAFADVPDDPDAFLAQLNKQDAETLAKTGDVASRATVLGKIGGFVGGMKGSLDDPVNLFSLPLGGGGKTLLQATWRAGLTNGLIELASQPGVKENMDRLGLEYTTGDAAKAVTFAAAGGAVFEAGGRVAVKAIAKTPEALFPHLPKKMQDIAYARALASGTVDDRALVMISKRLRNPSPEIDTLTPTERDAIRIAEQDIEVRESSPFRPDLAEFHDAQLVEAQRAIAEGQAIPRIPPPLAPVDFAKVKGAIGGFESGGSYTARNPQPGQSASGKYQFIDRTWLGLGKQLHPDLADAQIMAMKADPVAQERFMDHALEGYSKALRQRGAPVTDGNLYLMHFLGPQKAIDVLRASPDTPMAQLLDPSVIAVNKRLLEGKTAGDLIADMDRKMGGDGNGGIRAEAVLRDDIGDEPIRMRAAEDLDAEWATARRVFDEGVDLQPMSVRAIGREFEPIRAAHVTARDFDDPVGSGAEMQMMSIAHDLQAGLDSGELATMTFATDGIAEANGGMVPTGYRGVTEVLQALDDDDAVIAAIRGCL